MKSMKTNKKAEKLLAQNLAYLRLQGDLWAIEAELSQMQVQADKQPQSDIFQRFLLLIKDEIKNGLIRKNAEELEREKAQAVDAITAFENTYGKKAYALAKNPEKLQKYIKKKAFKKDKNGLERVRFALAFALDGTNNYRRGSESMQVISETLFDDPAQMSTLCESLRTNFNAIRERSIVDIQTGWMKSWGMLSVLLLSDIAMSVTGALSLMEYVKNKKKIDQAFKAISPDEMHALLAIKLTVLEEGKKVLGETEYKELIDDFLRHIDSIRSDSEYTWLVENEEIAESKERIGLCDRCIARLAQIVK